MTKYVVEFEGQLPEWGRMENVDLDAGLDETERDAEIVELIKAAYPEYSSVEILKVKEVN
jgi:hypothetical protein